MKQKFLTISILCAFLGLTNHMNAQVTIGSDASPIPGALLDLNDGTSTSGPLFISKGGLGLPRVNLTKVNELIMGNIPVQDGPTAGSSTVWQDHAGLLVYNTNRCFYETGNDDGVYVWDGSKWLPLNERKEHSSVVYTVEDDRGSEKITYLARNFGEAGDWLVENVRYVDSSMTLKAGSNNFNDKTYTYPSSVLYEESTPPEGWTPDQGFLYSYEAATLGAQTSLLGNKLRQGQGELEESSLQTIQGVCPNDWHIPSDREWNALEKEVYNKPYLYSYYTIADEPFEARYNPVHGGLQTGWIDKWEGGPTYVVNNAPHQIGHASRRGATNPQKGGHSLALMTICALTNETALEVKGLVAKEGGFAAKPIGFIFNNGVSPTASGFRANAYFWTSSLTTVDSWENYAYARALHRGALEVAKMPYRRNCMKSIRCKKNTP